MKHFQINIKYLVLAALSLAACEEDGQTPAPAPELSFSEANLPVEPVSFEAGTLTLEVAWAYTDWQATAGEAVEGEEFITGIDPAEGGSAEEGETETEIQVTFKSNAGSSVNRQKLILSSASGELTDTITIAQAGKPAEPVNLTIDPSVVHQTVAGFGGANVMWGTSFLTAGQLETVFGEGDDNLGFSIFRVRISPNEAEWAPLATTLKEAMKYNIKIIASPWSPPTHMKSNGAEVGGELLEEHYADYAEHLNDFVAFMAAEGVEIYAISIQNEPDIRVSYESCDWTPEQMVNFLTNHADAIEGTKIAAPESFNFSRNYTDVLLNDEAAVDKLDIVAGHIYGAGLSPYPLAEEKGKEIWMTEYLMNMRENWDQSEEAIWDETISMLSTVHRSMAYNWNAYIWWYIRRYYSFIGDGEEGTTRGEILKRGYAMSQYAKFVRPGYVRVDVQGQTPGAFDITAYQGDGKMVAVILNRSEYPLPEVNLSLPGSIASAAAYTTSLSSDRAPLAAEVDGNTVTVSIAERSVTTVVIE